MKKVIIIIICVISFFACIRLFILIDNDLVKRSNYSNNNEFRLLGINDALLAEGMIHGQLSLPIPSNKFLVQDTIILNNQVYIAFAPLPAILLIPFVYFFGPYFVTQALLTLLATVASFFIIIKILSEFRVNQNSRFYILTWFFFGSLYLIDMFNANVWSLQHIVGITFILTAILTAHKKFPSILDGFLISAAFLSRETLILYIPLILFIYFKEKKWNFWHLCFFFVPIILTVLIILGYNFVRFGNYLEFGHNLNISTIINLKRDAPDGLFNIKYLIRNLIIMISYPPVTKDFVYIIPSFFWRYSYAFSEPIASIFLTMLAPIIFLFKTNYRKTINIILILTIFAFLLVTLLWFRLDTSYLIDTLPAFLLLFIFVLNDKIINREIRFLILFSVLFMSYWLFITTWLISWIKI